MELWKCAVGQEKCVFGGKPRIDGRKGRGKLWDNLSRIVKMGLLCRSILRVRHWLRRGIGGARQRTKHRLNGKWVRVFRTILQASRHRINHRTLEIRLSLSFRTQLLQGSARGCCEPTIDSCCSQLQKSHESSFDPAQNNKRNAKRESVYEWILTLLCFLRDD